MWAFVILELIFSPAMLLLYAIWRRLAMAVPHNGEENATLAKARTAKPQPALF